MNKTMMQEQLRIEEAFTDESAYELSSYGDTSEAWQYKMRKEYAEKESVCPYWENYNLSIKDSVVREITYAEAKSVIEKYEWLKCMPVCVKHCYGLFFPHKTDGKRWLLGGGDCFCTGVRREYGRVG